MLFFVITENFLFVSKHIKSWVSLRGNFSIQHFCVFFSQKHKLIGKIRREQNKEWKPAEEEEVETLNEKGEQAKLVCEWVFEANVVSEWVCNSLLWATNVNWNSLKVNKNKSYQHTHIAPKSKFHVDDSIRQMECV